MCFKVPDQDASFSRFKYHHFRLAQHGKAIHVVLENDLVNHSTIFIHVSETILPEASDPKEDDGVIAEGADHRSR